MNTEMKSDDQIISDGYSGITPMQILPFSRSSGYSRKRRCTCRITSVQPLRLAGLGILRIERLPSGEALFLGVPVGNRRLSQLPAQQHRLAVHQRRKGEQPLLQIFYRPANRVDLG